MTPHDHHEGGEIPLEVLLDQIEEDRLATQRGQRAVGILGWVAVGVLALAVALSRRCGWMR